MNKNFKTSFSNICIPKETENKILKMTVSKEIPLKRKKKFVYICVSMFMAFTIMTTVVYAKEIKQFFEKWTSSILFNDGERITIIENSTFKKIPITAKKTKGADASIEMNLFEIEEMLKIDLLDYKDSYTNKMYYRTSLNTDDTIGRIDIWWPNFKYKNENEYVSISISMLNENADDGYVLAFKEGLDATAEKELDNVYTSDNLKTDVIIYSNEWSDSRITATFCYDDILYTIIGYNTTHDEIKKIIEDLN